MSVPETRPFADPTNNTDPDAVGALDVGRPDSRFSRVRGVARAGRERLTAPGKSHPVPASVLLVLLGLGLLFAGTSPLDRPVLLQVAVVLVGLVAIFKGLDGAGKVAFGPRFDTTFWLCSTFLILVIAGAALAPVLPLPEHINLAKTLDEPRYAPPDLFSEHPLGTGNFGLDLLARVLYGARVSLVVSVSAVVMGMVVGGTVGIVAGYLRGAVDSIVGVITNTWLAYPPLILLLALASVLTPNLRNIALALAVLAVPSMIRLARANTLAFTEREFVFAARALGATRRRIMLRELLPNVALPVAAFGVVIISVLIVAEASLSFLGLGIQPPQPSWGNMIAEGQNGVFAEHPHIVLVPGAFLFLTVFSFNLVGEKARKRWDPRQTKT